MLLAHLASQVYQNALNAGVAVKTPYVSIVDFTLPSNQKRMFVFNEKTHQLVEKLYVAQGKNSGVKYATQFSNQPQSYESSLGVYLTGNSYTGKHGKSMRLQGLTPNFNTNASKRAIVVHSAWYLTHQFIESHGRAGRSWGCFALSPSVAKSYINLTKNGSLIVAYYPNHKLMQTTLMS